MQEIMQEFYKFLTAPKDDNINIRVGKGLKEEFEKLASSKNKKLGEFVLDLLVSEYIKSKEGVVDGQTEI